MTIDALVYNATLHRFTIPRILRHQPKSLSRDWNAKTTIAISAFRGINVTVSLEQLQLWLETKEDEHLECKEAKHNFHFENLVKYCVALANEGGG